MNNMSLLLSKIKENNSKIQADRIESILVLYDLNMFAIGDTCIQFARFKKLTAFYKNAITDVNTLNTTHYRLICNIIKYNPYISNYYNLQWDQIDFSKYDLIICASIPELPFLEFLSLNYFEKIISGQMMSAIFSVSGTVGFDEKRYGQPIFDINEAFNEFKLPDNDHSLMAANELFISDAEIEWSTSWLEKNGVELNDNLVIFFDSSSARDKLLKINDYFDVLIWFLGFKDIKILIFDENGVGKKEFYEAWLGAELSAKLIFAKQMSLRDAICLIGSKKTKLVFGPSTGLLHCASGIFNVFLQKTHPPDIVPIMIGYIGKCTGSYQENQWWGHSLVDIVLPIKNGDSKELYYLKNVDFNQISLTDRFLSSHEITSKILIDFIEKNYSDKLNKIGINMKSKGYLHK